MDTIVTIPVRSSNIREAGYDAARSVLRVVFKGGAAYDYAGVPPEISEAFFAAESLGTYLAQHIKGRFAATKLPAPAEQKPAA